MVCTLRVLFFYFCISSFLRLFISVLLYANLVGGAELSLKQDWWVVAQPGGNQTEAIKCIPL